MQTAKGSVSQYKSNKNWLLNWFLCRYGYDCTLWTSSFIGLMSEVNYGQLYNLHSYEYMHTKYK